MQTLFAFGVVALMMLGVIALGEIVVRWFKPRPSESVEPPNYDGIIDATANGLSGVGEHGGQAEYLFGQLSGHVVSTITHLFHP